MEPRMFEPPAKSFQSIEDIAKRIQADADAEIGRRIAEHRRSPVSLQKVVPQSDDRRLGAWLLSADPDPLSANTLGVWCWFRLVEILADKGEGLTARQLARRLDIEHRASSVAQLLDRLCERGALARTAKGGQRYGARPLERVLGAALRQFPRRLPQHERDAFELAVLEYQEAPCSEAWEAAGAALVALLRAVPGWPEAIAQAAEAAPAEWLRHAAGLEPPGHALETVDPLVASLRLEIASLQAELAARDERLADAESENAALRARLEELEAWWEAAGTKDPIADFLAGHGRAGLPAELSDAEVERLRGLVLATRADRRAQRAIAAGLAEVYRDPIAHQRLTTLSFKEHPFDSLWRARLGTYRIVYGMTGMRPHPIVIATRGEVYERTVHALKNRQF
jgi:transcriptional regulator with XRE-family HTH domain